MADITFDNIWYLPSENRWRDMQMMAFRDAGRLIVRDNSLEFQGKKDNVTITNIRRVSCGRQGRDFMNKWVKVEYGDGATAFFADGSMLGWGGILGGTNRIFEVVSKLLPGG